MGVPARTPVVVLLALLAVLVAVGLVTERDQAPDPGTTTPIAVLARRVEALRDLRFRTPPRAQRVTPAEARREGLADLDRGYPPAARRADAEVLVLLGLAPPGLDLRAVSAALFEEGVAGYYDPRSDRLRVVEGAATASPVLTETTLAHELTHALEDQRFGLEQAGEGGLDDRALARLALVEGTATDVMARYAQRWLAAGAAGLAGAGLGEAPLGIPPFLEARLVFPYLSGLGFVAALRRTAGGDWRLLDTSLRDRPPVSSEQVLHPEAWLRAEPPRPVPLRTARVLGSGWRRVTAGTWGEWATQRLLHADAAGWGGDRYELWQRPGAASCRAPCRAHDALVLRWRWDTPAAARRGAAAVRRWAAAPPAGSAGVAVATRGGVVTLALAPTRRLAHALAAGA